MDLRLLDVSQLSFSAVYCCDDSETLSRVLGFAKAFPRCSAAAWWTDATENTVFLVFDTAIPVFDCASFYPEEVDASFFYAPSKVCGPPAGFAIFKQQDK